MDNYTEQQKRRYKKEGSSSWVGIVFLAVGGLLLFRMAGFEFADWLFRWEFILIAIGLVIGAREGFRNLTWIILVGIGSFFLLDDLFPELPQLGFRFPLFQFKSLVNQPAKLLDFGSERRRVN